MSSINAAARVAIAATLALIVLAACTLARQGGQGSTTSAAATGQENNGPQRDPNIPPSFNALKVDSMPIYWTYGVSTRPGVFFKNPQAEGDYLGFDEKGSIIRNQSNGKIYRWNLKENSLTVIANNLKELSLDELTSMRNTDQTVQYLLAQHGKAPLPATVPQQQPPQNQDKSAGLFGDNPQKTLQGLAPAGGVPADIAGKNASVDKGVLTFILADGSRSKPYTVVRPGFMANAPQSSGVTGTWIAIDSGGKGILFTVQADHTVTGKEISPQVVQMLMRRTGPPQ